jgi:ABC-type glycerol-3-phosphate transport system substrate-binding protein
MIRVLVLALLVALTATACGSHKSPGTASSAAPRALTDLHDINQLRTAFNKASHEPRLIVLVSPT